MLAGNRTALAGRVVDTERNPLARVAIVLDTTSVSTDANGNFLMLDPPVGDQVVLIDGDPANSSANRYPTIPVSLTIVANRLTEPPYLPHLHRQHERFTPIHPTQKTVATDPDLPGVALHLEGGNDAANRLVSVTNPAGGVTQYTNDSQHRMTTITDPRGITYLTNTYDANYRVCQQSPADGGVYTMYDVTTDFATTPRASSGVRPIA